MLEMQQKNSQSAYNEEECMPLLISSDKIKAKHFHSTKCFIDDICLINNCGNLEGSFVLYTQRRLSLRLSVRLFMLFYEF